MNVRKNNCFYLDFILMMTCRIFKQKIVGPADKIFDFNSRHEFFRNRRIKNIIIWNKGFFIILVKNFFIGFTLKHYAGIIFGGKKFQL